jgi:hypothetical protein
MQGDGGEDGQQVGEAGRDISSTPSGDVEILEEQDQELVVGTGTHLGGVVAKARAKVKHTNACVLCCTVSGQTETQLPAVWRGLRGPS